MERLHVLLVTFPAQGHINPSLQFAKRLIHMGIDVTFATSISARRRMAKASTTNLAWGLSFLTFSDGYDDGYKLGDDADRFMFQIRSNGSKALKETILDSAAQGRPVTCVVYTILLPWVAVVARELHVPSALLWIQPATVLSIYYHYFNGLGDEITANSSDPTWKILIPGAPALTKHDLPSFLIPSTSPDKTYDFALPTFKEQFETLDAETRPKVLVNTFDALEPQALRCIDGYELIGVGPLIPTPSSNGSDDKSFNGTLFKESDVDYMKWLNSNPESSVVYVSFGSLLILKNTQMEEIAKGLISAGRPFLWVIRDDINKEEDKDEGLKRLLEELEKMGKIVPWCSQLEVLTHPSLGCFVTHCGWNSTLESLSCGVPVVAFPHWSDQGTNGKLIEDEWRTGVRVKFNKEGIVESEEVRRCVEEVMGGGLKSVEMKKNAERWKGLAREVARENGSSTTNLKAFFDQL